MTVVVSPLIALMKDQIDFLPGGAWRRPGWIRASSADEAREILGRLRAGQIKLLYVAPERLANERFLQTLGRLPIAMLAVDEAHCISEWGHNFRPDYMKLARLAVELKVGRVLALTATATPEVARDIAGPSAIADGDVVRTGFHRPNLTLRVTPTAADRRGALLLERLGAAAARADDRVRDAAATAEEVGGVPRGERAAGRGVPRGAGRRGAARHPGPVHGVGRRRSSSPRSPSAWGSTRRTSATSYHYNLPEEPGELRAGDRPRRARRQGVDCEVLAVQADAVVTLENFTYGDTPTEEAVAALVATCSAGARRSTCRPTSCPATTTSARWSSRRC